VADIGEELVLGPVRRFRHLLCLPERRLSPLDVGDIDDAARDATRLARVIALGDSARKRPPVRPILVTEPILGLIVLGFAGQIGRGGSLHLLAIVGVHEAVRFGRIEGRFARVVAEWLPAIQEGRRAVRAVAVGQIHFPDADVRGADCQIQANLCHAERLLDALALRHIQRDCEDGVRMALLIHERRYAIVDPNL